MATLGSISRSAFPIMLFFWYVRTNHENSISHITENKRKAIQTEYCFCNQKEHLAVGLYKKKNNLMSLISQSNILINWLKNNLRQDIKPLFKPKEWLRLGQSVIHNLIHVHSYCYIADFLVPQNYLRKSRELSILHSKWSILRLCLEY